MTKDKPLDRGFKDAIERDPEAFARAFGGLRLEPGVSFGLMEREQVLPAIQTDQMIRLKGPAGDRILHFEPYACYRSDVPHEVRDHAWAAAFKHRVPVYARVLIYRPEDCPRELPGHDRLVLGDVSVRVRMRMVRMWEEPLARVLGLESPPLLPLAPFLKATPAQVLEAGRRLRRHGDKGLLAWYAINVRARYNIAFAHLP